MIIEAPKQGNQVLPAKSDSARADLNYDSFLKLMLEQLKSQDPMNPVDQTESLAQLASFSNVEQGIKLNQKLDALLRQSSVAESASLIGKTVQSLTDGNSGVVAAVEVRTGGTELIFSDGRRMPMVDGLRITVT